MKKRMNNFAVLGILVLLGLGYVIPTVVVAVEDNSLQSERKTFEVDEIELDFNDVDLVEVLNIVPDLLVSNVIIERGDEEKEDTQKYNMAKTSVKELLQVLKVEEEIIFETFSVSYYVMMADLSGENVYPLWKCFAMDEDKNEYCFWIDDISGKVIAFEIPISIMKSSDSDFMSAMFGLGQYYELSVGGLLSDADNFYKLMYWEDYLWMVDDVTGEELYLYIYRNGDSLCFNMYPGTIGIYSYESETDSSWMEN